MTYRDHAGSKSARTIEPHRLVSAGYRWYLMTFDTGRDDWRTFRVDRIEEAKAGGRFVPRDAPEATQFVASAVTTAPYRYQARILLCLPTPHAPPDEVAGLISPTSGVLTPAAGGASLLKIGSDSLGAMTYHLLALGVEFTVLEPPELIEHVRTAAWASWPDWASWAGFAKRS
jgi:predicted DNA-binding transcriptional regulator YafY